jgi:hypothetical protein
MRAWAGPERGLGSLPGCNPPVMLSTLLGWRLGGAREDLELQAPSLTRAKDALLGGAAFHTVASANLGASTAAVSRG